MWKKDSKGNWFMTNIDVISERGKSSNFWEKDNNGNWSLKVEKTNIQQVHQFSMVTGKALGMAC